MSAFFAKAFHFLLCGIVTLGGVFGTFTGDKEGKIQNAKENCRASFGLMSDLHLTEGTFRRDWLEIGFADMENAVNRLDAAVFVGDITDYGYTEMYNRFAQAMGAFDIADQSIMVIGNHDTRGHNKDENIEIAEKLALVKQDFIKYNKEITGRDIDNVYYSTTVNGYPVIVLGSEGNQTYATVSDEQIKWFAAEMAKAAQTGLPIFVFFHQPINQTHGLPYIWDMKENDVPERGGIGDASGEILSIIQQYKNVFYISGHTHNGLSVEESGNRYVSVEKYDGYTLINVPCYTYPDVKRSKVVSTGTGYIMEVYDNEVMFRARNFQTGTWCTKYDETIPLTPVTK